MELNFEIFFGMKLNFEIKSYPELKFKNFFLNFVNEI